ncbi:hypothetical protein D3C85_1084220 [compost metagenome]
MQLADLIVARQRLHALFKLAVLAQQRHILIVGCAFLRAGDQLLVARLGLADLLVALVEQGECLLLGVCFAVDQQAVGQHPQTQCQLGELIEALDARYAVLGNVLGGPANLAHLVQGEYTENQHQRANQGKAGERPGGDVHRA